MSECAPIFRLGEKSSRDRRAIASIEIPRYRHGSRRAVKGKRVVARECRVTVALKNYIYQSLFQYMQMS